MAFSIHLQTRSRRHQRLLLTSLLTLAFILIVIAVLALRPRAAVYQPGESIAGITSELGRDIPSDWPRITFVDKAAESGIRFVHFSGARSSQLPEDMGSGAAWGDYDRDGWPDLFLANEAGPLTLTAAQIKTSPARCALYHNEGGRFTDVTDSVGLSDLRGCFMGAAWGDYDNDGFPDLFVTSYGENGLFHNDGHGHFKEVTLQARIGGVKGFWTGVSWGDYDRDGFTDAYVCGYVKYQPMGSGAAGQQTRRGESDVPSTLNPSSYPPERNLLYHNNRDGTFTEVAHELGVDDPTGRSLSAAWCDFDGDGWPDLYVNNDVSMHAFYQNVRGKFKDIGVASLACDYRGGMGIGIGDWDNNGQIDMFLTHWIAQENALYHRMRELRRGKNLPPRFMDISDNVGLGQSTLDYIGWGTSFIDIDNDGRLDLVMANGSTFQEQNDHSKLVAMKNQLFWNGSKLPGFFENNMRDRGFFEVEDVAGDALRQPNVGRGLAIADYDRDGAPDILIVRHGAAPLLLHNEGGARNNWLSVELRGSRFNRDAIGARITVKAGGEKQIRMVGSTPSYLSQNEFVEHFGLGANAQAESLEVVWPDGSKQEFANIPARQLVRVTEGAKWQTVNLRRESAR